MMEFRQLGGAGVRVPALSLGTATFEDRAVRQIDIALDAGANLIDTADIYGDGRAEEIVGRAVRGRRDRFLLSTKSTLRSGSGPNDVGSSRLHLTRSVEASLRRLGTDVIDLYHLHGFDAMTPIEEVLATLDALVRAGKLRYIAASNFSGWQLMKSLATSDRHGWSRYVAQQSYYSLVSREFEWELMPLGLDQKVGTLVWSPLGWGRLTGRMRRGNELPPDSRLHTTRADGPPVDDEHTYRVVDALAEVARETGKTIPQIALNWLLGRPTVSSVIIGARDEAQLVENLGALGWRLSAEHVERLERASQKSMISPYWHQLQFSERNPFPVPPR